MTCLVRLKNAPLQSFWLVGVVVLTIGSIIGMSSLLVGGLTFVGLSKPFVFIISLIIMAFLIVTAAMFFDNEPHEV